MPLYTLHNPQSSLKRIGIGEYTGIQSWMADGIGVASLQSNHTLHNLQIPPRKMGLGEYTGTQMWNPSNVNSLRLWLDASNPSFVYSNYEGSSFCSNGSPVGRWKAIIGGDALSNGTTQQPIYYINQSNGLGGILFNSTNTSNRMTASFSVASIAYPSTVAVVCSIISLSSFCYLWCGQTGYGLFEWKNATSSLVPPQTYNGTELIATSPTLFNKYTVIFATYNSSNSIIRQNGITIANGSSGTNNTCLGNNIMIANYIGQNKGACVSISELCVWDRALTLAEMIQLETHWKIKYKLFL